MMPRSRFARQMQAVLWSSFLSTSFVCAQTQSAPEHPVRFDAGTISGLPARNIGSATMSGRVAAIDAYNDNGRITVFAGSASGGVEVGEWWQQFQVRLRSARRAVNRRSCRGSHKQENCLGW